MSPELIAPHRFGLEDSRPTKSSDCYALGMVIYETISGHLPFHKHTNLVVFMRVSEGERPPREADSLWEMLGLCWAQKPNARPSVEDVLQYLESDSQSLELHSPGINGEVDESGDWDSVSDSSGMFSHSALSTAFHGLNAFRSLVSLFISVHHQYTAHPAVPAPAQILPHPSVLVPYRVIYATRTMVSVSPFPAL